MSNTTIIDGKSIAMRLRAELATHVQQQKLSPGLAVILVGEDPASHVYVRNKVTACEKTGIKSFEHRLPADSTKEQIADVITQLNNDPQIHGVLIQLPLPAHLATVQEDLVQMVSPAKDVDGLTIENAGKLFLGMKDGLVPCTPQGSLLLIKEIEKNISGMHAAVIGRSNLFGKPMGQLLLSENCTVTQCHSRTKDLPNVCARADILIAAVGRAKMVKSDWIKKDAIIIDVGINRMDNGKLCGDVDFDEALEIARAITPVPGGVGPMTIACLLQNTIKAAQGTST